MTYVIYFAENSRSENSGQISSQGTSFYSALTPKIVNDKQGFTTQVPNYSIFKLKTVEYKANTLVCFMGTPNYFHGVEETSHSVIVKRTVQDSITLKSEVIDIIYGSGAFGGSK